MNESQCCPCFDEICGNLPMVKKGSLPQMLWNPDEGHPLGVSAWRLAARCGRAEPCTDIRRRRGRQAGFPEISGGKREGRGGRIEVHTPNIPPKEESRA